MVKRNYLKTHSASRTAWTKRLLAAAAVVVVLVGLWKFIVGEMGVVKYYRMSAHARALRSEIDHHDVQGGDAVAVLRRMIEDDAHRDKGHE